MYYLRLRSGKAQSGLVFLVRYIAFAMSQSANLLHDETAASPADYPGDADG
jgi:hypothetical protein